MSGIFEILIILAIVLLLFGAKKLPAIGTSLGRMVRNFKAGQASREEIEVTPSTDGEKKLDE
ncbi:MAG: twin-arginine translocase TatA/TatE family subunit [Deltaproteobacteria bacterium]|jgi:sec-independent protein translocase protein TatA|nr:twin-arginine translocase TatA/TatE family subunit [Deltaproteobacteria bacterium]